MRKFVFAFLILFAPRLVSLKAATGTYTVTQEIKYYCPHAEEVFFVWGINDWQAQDKEYWPEGTYLKDKLLSTPMKSENGFFSVRLNVKAGTIIDYVFWITKGPKDIPSDIWDANRKPQSDYHTLAVNDNITIVRSQVEIKPQTAISVLDFSGSLLILVSALLILFYISKKYFFKDAVFQPSQTKIIMAGAFVLMTCLFLLRVSVLALSWDLYYHPLNYLPEMLYAGFYDYLYVAVITLIFLGLLLLFKKSPRTRKVVVVSFVFISFVSLLAGILNIRVTEMIGKPFNYRWFYYSDFLNSTDAKAAILSNVSDAYILDITRICISSVIACILMVKIIQLILLKFRIKKVLLTILILLNFGYIIFAGKGITNSGWSYDKVANPVTVFLGSVNPLSENAELFSMEVPDSLKFQSEKYSKTSEFHKQMASHIKNVIVVVMESTAAEYVEPYDAKFRVTPHIASQFSNAIVFNNIYAHAPATNKSMLCLMGSVYPWLSYNTMTNEYPHLTFPTISSVLKEKGFRTAFFNSGDNRFQKGNEFLADRKFDLVKDKRSVNCDMHFKDSDPNWDALDGVDDECTGNELIEWIGHDTSKPFFAMMWTFQTHYPYYCHGQLEKYVYNDDYFNRYLNAIHHSDQVLGKIIDHLRKNNLFESTLILILADHGEAFGRHEQIVHASKIYEENLHIPCILINPAFKSERKTTLGGMVDIAPTILDVLGMKGAKEWQGQSLFSEYRNNRVYFFAPWSDYLFGYREGSTKFIFNASKNTTELYDLSRDPYETNNLSAELETGISNQRLAAWIQYQDSFMKSIIKKEKH